jgi:hypothetical protein
LETITRSGLIIKKETLLFLAFYLIIPCSSFVIHKGIQIPPTLLLFLIGTTILVIFFPKVSTSYIPLLAIAIVAYFLITQTLIGAPFRRYIGVLSSILYFVVVVSMGYKLNSNERNSLASNFIKFSTLMLVMECIWRLTHPDLMYKEFADAGDPRWIYQYKIASFMYGDSNAVGIHIIVILFFIFYLENEKGVRWPLIKIILIVLLILTFSRAAWAGGIIGWVYFKFLLKRGIVFYLISLISILCISILVYRFYLYDHLRSDLSFQSKFEIIKATMNYISHATWLELLLGIGFSNSLQRMEVYAHSFFIIFFIESGIIGLILMILLFMQFIAATKKKALYILVPFIITTLSSSITFIPFFYVVMGMIYLEERHDQYEIKPLKLQTA